MSQSGEASIARTPGLSTPLRLLFDLFKLRIGLAIGLAALTGAMVTPGPLPQTWRLAALTVAVTLTSAAAGAFNQYVERDLDARMRRTRGRAFVTGQFVAGPEWLVAIAAMAVAGIALAQIAGNTMSAIYTFLGAFTYSVVYTLWLKRRTWWNIVIGGLAGSFAVLAGAAAVSPTHLTPMPLMFALLLFLWTPPHFWSLAIAYRDDYAAARIPMLPVVVGTAHASRAVLLGALLLVAASFVPAALGLGWPYLAGAIGGGAYFVYRSALLAHAPNRRWAMTTFYASLFELTLLLVSAIVDTALRG